MYKITKELIEVLYIKIFTLLWNRKDHFHRIFESTGSYLCSRTVIVEYENVWVSFPPLWNTTPGVLSIQFKKGFHCALGRICLWERKIDFSVPEVFYPRPLGPAAFCSRLMQHPTVSLCWNKKMKAQKATEVYNSIIFFAGTVY